MGSGSGKYSSEEQCQKSLMWDVDGEGVGSRVQDIHARGPGYAFHSFNTAVVLSQTQPRNLRALFNGSDED